LYAIGKPLQVLALTTLTGVVLSFPARSQEAPEARSSQADSGLITTTGRSAGQLPRQIPEDYYRAELLIIKRKVDPQNVNEKMGIHTLNLTPEQEHKLLVIGPEGSKTSTLDLIPDDQLHLSSAAQRLTRSGRFKVLALTGWYQAFPPDYAGNTMQVALGDWLEDAGHREVEGTITIDRQRYLHVNVTLNHWYSPESGHEFLAGPLPMATIDQAASGDSPEPDTTRQPAEVIRETDRQQAAASVAGERSGPPALRTDPALKPAAELLTWIRETRRMRSKEVHYLDSPTIGVLVYFSPIEPRDE
jgi:hypothetical protein